MTPGQFRQVEDFFHRAKGLPPEEQRALLDAECGDGDAEVRAEVEKLLAQADPQETLADLKGKVDRVLRPGADDPSAATAGPIIEGYDILREIHRGGQGVVYQAVQKSTKRKVAIKVLLEGPYASKSARRRFEREIELVAQLKHPNIVSIFHSGQTSEGRQYCVMDYVRGVPLDQYVRQEKLTLEDALRLFAKVCEAVNYAHQKGVIHRDLKPSNILVTPPLPKGGPGGDGRGKDASGTPANVGDPKVLDFGLAKQLISREASLISLTGQVVGTLPYMSPEQAEGNPDKIDIRTDVYALGVILYQMLTGHYPYPVAGQMAEVLKHIAETEPTPPTRSWKSGTGVTQRTHKRIRPGQCPIDDEVQTIVMRTLAKERERRYQSAGELANDVGHYLADEPIDAKRDSAFYVIRKQLRRYKLPVAVAAAFVLLLSGATVALLIMYQNQSRARAAETKQRHIAEAKTTEAIAAQVTARTEKERAEAALEEMDEARKEAERQRIAALEAESHATRARDDALLLAYAGAIRAADLAVSLGDSAAAMRQLNTAPEHLQDWEWRYLRGQADESIMTLVGHTSGVRPVAFSPDGSRLASGSDDKTIRIWDSHSGEKLLQLPGHEASVTGVAFSPDGARLVSGSRDRTLKLWNADTGTLLNTLQGHTAAVKSVAFSPNGEYIASGAEDRTAKIWNAAESREMASLQVVGPWVYAVAFDPSSRVLATGIYGPVQLWQLPSGRELPSNMAYPSYVRCVAFSPSGEHIVCGGGGGVMKLWDASSFLELATVKGHTDTVLSAVFSPDGKRIATGSVDTTIRIWDSTLSKELAVLRGHARPVNSVAFSPDGVRLASGSFDGTIKFWRVEPGQRERVLRGHTDHVWSVAISPDGKIVASLGASDPGVRLWNVATGEQSATLGGHRHFVSSTAFSPDGRRLASGSRRTVNIWDVETGRKSSSLQVDKRARFVAFNPDGKKLAVATPAGSVTTWDWKEGKQLTQFQGHSGGVQSIAFGAEGTMLAAGSAGRRVRIWDARTGKPLFVLTTRTGHNFHVLAVVFSPDGRRLAAGGEGDSIRVFDTRTGKELYQLAGFSGVVASLAFNPSGTRIAAACRDGVIRIWDARSGVSLMSLRGHSQWVRSVSFSPDGRRIISGSDDGTIRIWE